MTEVSEAELDVSTQIVQEFVYLRVMLVSALNVAMNVQTFSGLLARK